MTDDQRKREDQLLAQVRARGETIESMMARTSREMAEQRRAQLAPAPHPSKTQPDAVSPDEDPDDGTTNDLDTWWLPEPVRDWCEAIASAYAVPKVMPIAAALCAASSVLQGRVKVRIKRGWEEPLCLFWLVFVRTGGQKSSVMKLARRALLRWQDEIRVDVERDAKVTDFARKRLEAQLRRLRSQKRGSKGPLGATRESHAEWLSEVKELEHEISELPSHATPDLYHSDINPSLIPKVLRRNFDFDGVARFAVLDDEGVFLANMLGRHQGQPMLEMVLKAYGGEYHNVVRAQKAGDDYVGIPLPSAHATMCVFAQPHYHDLITDTELLSTSGFVGRCMVDLVDAGRPPWDAPPVPEHVQDAYDSWLLEMAEGSFPEVVDLGSDPESRDALKRCYERALGDDTGTARRIVGRVARIVAIVSIVSGGGGVAGAREIDHLFELLYLKRLRTIRAIDRPVEALSTIATATLQWVRDNSDNRDNVWIRDIQRGLCFRGNRLKAETIRRALDELAEGGYLEWDMASRSKYRGKDVARAVRLVPRAKPRLRAVEPDPDPEGWDRGSQ